MDESLASSWETQAAEWIAWSRAPGHDSYWTFHRERFLELTPAPGRLTLDIGCGEGRVGRDLADRGHRVLGLDHSEPAVRACVRHRRGHPAVIGDAARLPFTDAIADVVIGFMSFHDLDDLESAVAEVARVLHPGGRLHLAIVHPLNSAGTWAPEPIGGRPDFVIEHSYLALRRYADTVERDGLTMTFHSMHRPLAAYARLLTTNGFVIEVLDEVADPDPASKWSRIPLFLHIVARR